MASQLRASDQRTSFELTVNGIPHNVAVPPWVTLLDLLRERLRHTGTKKGCDHGQCGACTVLVDGRRINSCLKLAICLDGAEITTIEGMESGGKLHPLQTAFIEHDALQCGYCTPGQICSAQGLRRPRPKASRDPRINERQPVSLRRLLQHRGCSGRDCAARLCEPH